MPSAQDVRAGKAYIELYTKDSRLVKGLAAAQKRLEAFGAAVRSIGTRLLGLGTALTAPILGAVGKFLSAGDQLEKMAARTSASTEALSELGFAAEQSGQNLEVVEQTIRKMQKTIGDAATGSASATQALKQLGLSADDLLGLAPEDQLELIADRLAKISDPTLRAAAAMDVFGRSGTALLPLFKDGAAGIQALRKEARELGLSISPEDAKRAAELTDAWNRVKRAFLGAAFAVGSAVAPTLIDLAEKVKRIIVTASNWVRQNKSLVVSVFKVGLAVIAAGAALVAVGAAFSGAALAIGLVLKVIAGIGAAISLLGTLLAALLSPIGLVVAAVVALGAYILTSTDAGAQALAWLGKQFQDLKDTALAAWQGIADALAAGDIALAAKILWLTLKLEWQKGINFLNQQWQAWKAFFLRVFNEAVFSLAGMFTDAWAALQTAWVETVGFLADAWTIFTSAVMKGWRTAQNFLSKGILRLMKLLDDSLDVEGASKILDEDFARAQRSADEEVTRTIVERDQKRQERLKEIEDQRQGSQAQLDQMRGAEEERLAHSQSEALAASQSALDEARRQWQDALGEAARKREEAEAARGAPGGVDRAKQSLDGLDDFLGAARKRTVDVTGTFNAAAIRGLASGGAADRTAQAVEAMDKKLGLLVREVQHGGLVFA